MKNKICILGIDTSNYTTSVAAIDSNKNIISDRRKLLKVKQGERGLRQSDALFQHITNLPEIIYDLKSDIKGYDIKAVSVSALPRPTEGSYMPVFRAGISLGKSVASLLNVPIYEFSHQEGHIAAVKSYSGFKDKDKLLCCHFSGGTCEILCCNTGNIEIIGGSLDISFGQLLDRTGVAMGMNFPCGSRLDNIAVSSDDKDKDNNILSKIKVKDCRFNLSGTETQIMKAIGNQYDFNELTVNLFDRITACLAEAVNQAVHKSHINTVLFAGGVCASNYIRKELGKYIDDDISYEFGDISLSSDNAVGTALLGGEILWQQNP